MTTDAPARMEVVGRREWTDDEVALLLEAHGAGVSRREIARKLGRPKATIDYRLAVLGVRDAPRPPSAATRFWKYVEVGSEDECWPWTGYTDEDGYGSLSLWPTRVGAHRMAYELRHGPIDDGLVVRHDCDNPLCCNAAHLRIGTTIDNNRDKAARGRDAKGEGHGMARYSIDQVREVKRLLALGGSTYAQIAVATEVNVATVSTIARGRQWTSA